MKIVIDINENNISVTTESKGTVYPICTVTPDKFEFSNVTNISRITYCSAIINQLAKSMEFQIEEQNIINKSMSNSVADAINNDKRLINKLLNLNG